MLTISPESHDNVLVCTAKGRLTDGDYEQVLLPTIESVTKLYGKVRMLFEFSKDFRGWDIAALWDDMRFGVKHRHDFEKLAVVGGSKWIGWATKIEEHIISGETKAYAENQRSDALAWVAN